MSLLNQRDKTPATREEVTIACELALEEDSDYELDKREPTRTDHYHRLTIYRKDPKIDGVSYPVYMASWRDPLSEKSNSDAFAAIKIRWEI